MLNFIKRLFAREVIKLGNLRKLDDITLNDMKKHIIWVNDLSGEVKDGFDETSEKPVINTKNVSAKMLSDYVSTSILIKLFDGNFGVVSIEKDWSFSSPVIWHKEEWISLKQFYNNSDKVCFTPIPTLDKKTNKQLNIRL